MELGPAAPVGEDADTLLFALRGWLVEAGPGDGCAAHRSAQAAVVRLRARLVGPLRVDPDAPLVVVPVGDLQRLPWAPLHRGPTTVVPSARVWLRTTTAPRRPGVALIAGPDLPGAVDEVVTLQEVHAAASVLLPPDSTCASAVALLRTSAWPTSPATGRCAPTTRATPATALRRSADRHEPPCAVAPRRASFSPPAGRGRR